jgi:hypothetical protein
LKDLPAKIDPPMTAEFHCIFGGIGMGSSKDCGNYFVDQNTIRINIVTEMGCVGLS